MNNFNKEILYLEKNGFTNFSSFFVKNEIDDVAKEIDRILKAETNSYSKRDCNERKKPNIKRGYNHTANYARTNTCSSSVAGKSKKIDDFLKNLFSNEKFNNLCERIVGKNYRIYTLAIRQLDSSSKPLGLHQDNFAQVTFTIPLNNISKNEGTTTVLPGSHIFHFPILDEFFNTPSILTNFLINTVQGKVGDLGIFLNKTFHGNCVEKNTNKKSTCVHIALTAEGGYQYMPFDRVEKTLYGSDFKVAVGEKIYNKLFSKEDLISSQDNEDNVYYTYLENCSNKAETKIVAKSRSGKSIKALNQALTREKKHLVDRIFLKKSYSPLKLFISLYIESISQLKKIILKTKRFF